MGFPSLKFGEKTKISNLPEKIKNKIPKLQILESLEKTDTNCYLLPLVRCGTVVETKKHHDFGFWNIPRKIIKITNSCFQK